MRGKIRFTKFIAMTVILSLCLSNAYAYSNGVQSINLDDNEIYSGKLIPAEVSTAAFSDEIDYDTLADFQFERAISISGDRVVVDLSLLIDSSEIQLQYDGEMYKSSRYTDENPIYVGVLEGDSTSDLEPIYFEISNDISPYNLNEELRESASITMYLQDNEGTIYDLGSEITSPLTLDGIENQAPSDKDVNWFLNYFSGTHQKIPSSLPASSYSDTWEGDTESLNFKVAGYEHIFTATPYIDFGYGDVPDAGETSFSMSLKIAETHKYRLTYEKDWTLDESNDYSKCFAIDNVELGWVAGGNTCIKEVEPHLRVHNKSNSSFSFTALISSVTSIFPQTQSLSAILDIADLIMDAAGDDSVRFTNTESGGSLTNTSAYKLIFPEHYYIEESGEGLSNTRAERFELIARMATVDSDLTSRYPTSVSYTHLTLPTICSV